MLSHCLWRAVMSSRLLGSHVPCLGLSHHKAALGSLAPLWPLHSLPFAMPKACVLVSTKQTLCTSRCWQQVREPKPHSKPVSVQTRSDRAAPQTATQKVKEAGRDFTYFIVVLIGIGITGGLFYVVFQELFSSSSPSKIYGDALEKCRSHPEVIGVLGEPIKGYGETTRRGRRQHVSHKEYVKDDVKCMWLKFYIQGSEPRKEGIVYVDVKENPESKKYEVQYIFVEIDTYPRRTIFVEDNRL